MSNTFETAAQNTNKKLPTHEVEIFVTDASGTQTFIGKMGIFQSSGKGQELVSAVNGGNVDISKVKVAFGELKVYGTEKKSTTGGFAQ